MAVEIPITVKNIPRDLWAQFKSKAARKGLRMRDAFILAIEKWITEG